MAAECDQCMAPITPTDSYLVTRDGELLCPRCRPKDNSPVQDRAIELKSMIDEAVKKDQLPVPEAQPEVEEDPEIVVEGLEPPVEPETPEEPAEDVVIATWMFCMGCGRQASAANEQVVPWCMNCNEGLKVARLTASQLARARDQKIKIKTIVEEATA